MDTVLTKRLVKVEAQIKTLYEAEENYLTLDAAKDHQRAVLMSKSEGSSQSAKEMLALATPVWESFMKSLAVAEATFHREKHTLDLKLKAFDAEYLTYKIENSAISRQK